MNLQPLDSDVHELATAHLDWSPIDQLPRASYRRRPILADAADAARCHGPLCDGGAGSDFADAARSATGAQAPISPTPPRSATGAQAPIPMTAPRSATGVQTPISPHPARPATQAAQPVLPAPRVPVTPEPITQPAASSSPPAIGAASQSAPPARTLAEPPTRRTAPPDDEPPTWTAARRAWPPRSARPPRSASPSNHAAGAGDAAPAAAPPRVATPLGSGLRGASPVLTPASPSRDRPPGASARRHRARRRGDEPRRRSR